MPGRLEDVNTTFMTDLYPIRSTAGDAMTPAAAVNLYETKGWELVNRHKDGLDPNTVAFVRPNIANAVNSRIRVVLAPQHAAGAVPTGAKVTLYAFFVSNNPLLQKQPVEIASETATNQGLPHLVFDGIPAACFIAILCDKPATIFFSHTL